MAHYNLSRLYMAPRRATLTEEGYKSTINNNRINKLTRITQMKKKQTLTKEERDIQIKNWQMKIKESFNYGGIPVPVTKETLLAFERGLEMIENELIDCVGSKLKKDEILDEISRIIMLMKKGNNKVIRGY